MNTIACPSPSPRALPHDSILGVGFGEVTVTRQDWRGEVVIWQGDSVDLRVSDIDLLAQTYEGGRSRAVWAIEFYGPLSGATYRRRVGDGEWILKKRNRGFA